MSFGNCARVVRYCLERDIEGIQRQEKMRVKEYKMFKGLRKVK
jgi:hypothetical protein